MCCVQWNAGMVIQIPSIPILVSVLFPSLNLKYFRIKFLLLVYVVVALYLTPRNGYCVSVKQGESMNVATVDHKNNKHETLHKSMEDKMTLG